MVKERNQQTLSKNWNNPKQGTKETDHHSVPHDPKRPPHITITMVRNSNPRDTVSRRQRAYAVRSGRRYPERSQY
ncbi:hypothetical protein GWI33_016986 [Rhynchophorus ferrugineus]|uniref:Uncharacterized protein n=1 Tax=Rhynchophorus ferrugineus TaxID=354439 RepID=A0A834HZ16_RHYFE|nr:hypothetical protein GWI33_016986 [Rhynchophorus ferrugineus]